MRTRLFPHLQIPDIPFRKPTSFGTNDPINTSAGCPHKKSTTTSYPVGPSFATNASANSSSRNPKSITASAPNPRTISSDFKFLPVPTTFPAPNKRATCTAIRPETPVAPLINTVSPANNFAEYFIGNNDVSTEGGIAAAAAGSIPAGIGTVNPATVFSANAPYGVRIAPNPTSVPSEVIPIPSFPTTAGKAGNIALLE